MHFFLRFALLFVPPYVALNVLPLAPLLEAIASFEAWALTQTGFSAKAEGVFLLSNGQPFEIVASCSGFVMVILTFALLYSTPLSNRLRYFSVFAPALFAFNLFRLYEVLAIGSAFPELLESAHVYLWFVDAALVLFLWWVAFASSGTKPGLKERAGKEIGEKR